MTHPVLTPMLGSVVYLFCSPKSAMRVSVLLSSPVFAASLLLWILFDSLDTRYQFPESLSWFSSSGLDGLSLVLFFLFLIIFTNYNSNFVGILPNNINNSLYTNFSLILVDENSWEPAVFMGLLLAGFILVSYLLVAKSGKLNFFSWVMDYFPQGAHVFVEPYNMGPGIILSLILATICGVIGFKYTWFVVPQIVICFLSALSFLGPQPIYWLLTEVEVSSKWILWGIVFTTLFGPTKWGFLVFCLWGLAVWLIGYGQGRFILQSWSILQEPMVLPVSITPLLLGLSSFLPDITRWGWFVELLVLFILCHQHFVEAWRSLSNLSIRFAGRTSRRLGQGVPSELFYTLIGGFNNEVFATRLTLLYFLTFNAIFFELTLSSASSLFFICLVFCFGFTHKYAVKLLLVPAWITKTAFGEHGFTLLANIWVFNSRMYLRFFFLALLAVAFLCLPNAIAQEWAALDYISCVCSLLFGLDLVGLLWLTAQTGEKSPSNGVWLQVEGVSHSDWWLKVPGEEVPNPEFWETHVTVALMACLGCNPPTDTFRSNESLTRDTSNNRSGLPPQ